MGAFDSIRMGYRCKAWLSQSDVPAADTSMISISPSDNGEQWILNATTGDRGKEVVHGSAVVLDGGPRWVLSTALGFRAGGLWWTIIFTALFVLGNYAIYVSTADAQRRFGSNATGMVAYTILAAALSMASVPGAWIVADVLGWKALTCGLAVELCLCSSVIVSVTIIHSFLDPYMAENTGLLPFADAGRWITPGLVWMAASKLRRKAIKAVKNKLAGLWCRHPPSNRSTSVSKTDLWNDWSANVKECASRVGGYSMLGFSASDLAALTESSPSPRAVTEIQKLARSISTDSGPTEPWIKNSLAFKEGYDARIRNACPDSGCTIIPLKETEEEIRAVISMHHPKVDEYQTKIENSHAKSKYLVNNEPDNRRWFYAGALIADSDHRGGMGKGVGNYGSRLAVSLAILVEGTDPLARLACYAESEILGSGVQMLSLAISSSVEALVSELADSASVTIRRYPLGKRGLAYATCSKTLTYSPDEMVAASHLEEAVVISDDTFSAGSAHNIFEKLWGGSANVDKVVDVRGMVPLAASASEAGASACRGWLCHVGFTLAILMAYLSGSASIGVGVLFLVAIPATEGTVSVHMNNHFYMIYISYILNYVRFASRGLLLSPRGQATLDKANNTRMVVFLFVNVLPVGACNVCSGWKWWVAFSPCILATLPGLLMTMRYGWASAFKYEWWSWHVFNRWYSGRSYLKIVGLRKRIGRNVLLVNNSCNTMEVLRVLPLSHTEGARFMVVGG